MFSAPLPTPRHSFAMNLKDIFVLLSDALSFIFNIWLISMAAMFDLVRTLWSRPSIIMTVNELFEEMKDSSVESLHFVLPSFSWLRATSSWTPISRTWTSPRSRAFRLRLQRVATAFEQNSRVPSASVPTHDETPIPELIAPASVPQSTTADSPTESAIPFNIDFVKQGQELAFGTPEPLSRLYPPAPPPSRKSSHQTRRRFGHSRIHTPSKASIQPIRSGNNGLGFIYNPATAASDFSLQQVAFINMQQQAIAHAEANAKMHTRAQAVQHLRLACAVRENRIKTRPPSSRNRSTVSSISRRTSSKTSARKGNKAKVVDCKGNGDANVGDVEVKCEPASIKLLFDDNLDKENDASVLVKTPESQKAIQEKAPKQKTRSGKERKTRRSGTRASNTKKGIKNVDNGPKKQKSSEKKASVVQYPVKFTSKLRATAPEFHMRTTLGDMTNA